MRYVHDREARRAAGFFLILEALLFYVLVLRHGLFGGAGIVPLGAAAAIALVVGAAAPVLKPAFAAVLRASRFAGRIVFGAATVLVFFVILTPAGLLKRLLGRPALALRLEPDRETYYEPWETAENVRKQY